MKNIFFRNNHYQFRKYIPTNMKPYFNNKNLYIRSMRTKNKAVALRFSKILLNKFNYISESIKMGMDEDFIKKIVYEFTNLTLEETELDLYNTDNIEDTTFYLLLDDTIATYKNCYTTNDYSIVKDDVKKIVNKLDITVEETDLANISKVLLDSHINNLKTIKENIETNVYSKPRKQYKVKDTIVPDGVKLNLAFEEYIANTKVKDKWSKDTLNLNELVKYLLELYFSSNKDITTISNKDLIEFRNILFKLPSKLKQRNQFKDKDLNYILNNCDGIDKLTSNTINKYIIRVNQFFKYCYQVETISKELQLEKIKEDSSKKREQYNKKELKCVFDYALNETEENKWIILLMMFEGMRLKEVTQLLREDIKQIDNVWCIDINDNEDKSVKTKNSIRTIPVNERLINLGFIDFIKDKNNNLFNIDNKKFSEYYRKKINTNVTKDKNKTLYSLRHNFIDFLIQNDTRTEHVASIVGHSQEFNITMGTYSNKINVTLLKSVINKVNYFIRDGWAEEFNKEENNDFSDLEVTIADGLKELS